MVELSFKPITQYYTYTMVTCTVCTLEQISFIITVANYQYLLQHDNSTDNSSKFHCAKQLESL